MSDENPTPDDAPKNESTEFLESLENVADYYGAPNRLLQDLADSADAGGGGSGIPITLFLHGGLVAGYIISSQEFYRAMADTFREGFTNVTDDGKVPAWADQFAKFKFESIADATDKRIKDDNDAFDEHGTKTSRWALTRHICLKEAHYTVPGVQSIRRDHVCIQLSQVVGWTLGVTSWQ